MLQLRRHEKDFLQRSDLGYRSRFKDTADSLSGSIAALAAEDALEADTVVELNTDLEQYVELFEDLVQRTAEIGLTDRSGVRAELRKLALVIGNSGVAENELDWQEIQECQKEFEQRPTRELVERFDAEIADRLKSLGGNQASGAWREYSEGFHRLVSLVQEVGFDEKTGLHGQMRERAHKLEAGLREATSRGATRASRRVEDLQRGLGLVALAFLATSTFGVLRLRSNLVRQEQFAREIALSEQRLRVTISSIGDGVIASDIDGCVQIINRIAEDLTGWECGLAVGRKIGEIFNAVNSVTRTPVELPNDEVIRTGRIVELANGTVLISRTGREHQIADSAAPIVDVDGTIIGVVLVFQNVTDRHELESRLRHTEKVESLGVLAGGIAHDFNNLLTGILGAAELLALRTENDESTAELIDVIVQSGEQASNLTRQLLSFSRRGKVLSEPVDVHVVLQETSNILRRSIDKRVDVSIHFGAENATVMGDGAQLSSVFLNLGVNAGEAMPDGGNLRIATQVLTFDDNLGQPLGGLSPGQYLEISFRDDGVGMSAETTRRAFEPYYTTKEHGTGLGLSSAFGSIRDHQGAIEFSSEMGGGTDFRVYLPATTQVVTRGRAEELPKGPPAGQGVVLLVDDEELVRSSTQKMLHVLGYECDVAEDGATGLNLFERDPDRYGLVLLDLILPDRLGSEIFKEIRSIKTHVPVVLFSGYTKDSDIDALRKAGLSGFLRKPFKIEALNQAIRSAMLLDHRTGSID